MNAQDSVNEYFRSLRDEIHLRIREHSRMVWIKVLSLGFTISFLVEKSLDNSEVAGSSLLYFVYMVPLAAWIFDTMIAGNLRDIMNLGTYMKKYMEGVAFGPSRDEIPDRLILSVPQSETSGDGERQELARVVRARLVERNYVLDESARLESVGPDEWVIGDRPGEFIVRGETEQWNVYLPFRFWEEQVAQACPAYRCYTMRDVVVIWLFTLAAWAFAIVLRWPFAFGSGLKLCPDSILMLASGGGAVYALIWLRRALKMERRF